MITKTIQSREESYITFTDEEAAQLGIQEGDKFTIEVDEAGAIKLTPYASIEIDLSELSREDLEHIIIASNIMGVTIEEYFEEVLTQVCEELGYDTGN